MSPWMCLWCWEFNHNPWWYCACCIITDASLAYTAYGSILTGAGIYGGVNYFLNDIFTFGKALCNTLQADIVIILMAMLSIIKCKNNPTVPFSYNNLYIYSDNNRAVNLVETHSQFPHCVIKVLTKYIHTIEAHIMLHMLPQFSRFPKMSDIWV